MITAAVRVFWRGDELVNDIKRAAAEGIFDAALIVREQIQVNISVVGPPHSLPGEAPHRISGELQNSVKIRGNRNKLEAFVIVEAPYALALEFGYAPRNLAPRPFIVRSFNEVKPQCQAAVVRAIRLGMGNTMFAD